MLLSQTLAQNLKLQAFTYDDDEDGVGDGDGDAGDDGDDDGDDGDDDVVCVCETNPPECGRPSAV